MENTTAPTAPDAYEQAWEQTEALGVRSIADAARALGTYARTGFGPTDLPTGLAGDDGLYEHTLRAANRVAGESARPEVGREFVGILAAIIEGRLHAPGQADRRREARFAVSVPVAWLGEGPGPTAEEVAALVDRAVRRLAGSELNDLVPSDWKIDAYASVTSRW